MYAFISSNRIYDHIFAITNSTGCIECRTWHSLCIVLFDALRPVYKYTGKFHCKYSHLITFDTIFPHQILRRKCKLYFWTLSHFHRKSVRLHLCVRFHCVAYPGWNIKSNFFAVYSRFMIEKLHEHKWNMEISVNLHSKYI